MSLEGRCALVTGGSRGLGRAISLALARAGADVAIMYQSRQPEAQETVAQVKALGRRGFAVQADVADYDRLRAAAEEAVSALGHVDILVNNAGVPTDGKPVANADVQVLRRIIEVNMFGPLSLPHALLTHLRGQAQRQGRADIIFLSTTRNLYITPGYAAYTMSKIGVEALMKVLAKEERPYGVRVNAIGPGLAETDMGQASMARQGRKDIKEIAHTLPFGRAVQPEEIGNLCVFLCSKEAEYITGQVIYVDGGFTLK